MFLCPPYQMVRQPAKINLVQWGESSSSTGKAVQAVAACITTRRSKNRTVLKSEGIYLRHRLFLTGIRMPSCTFTSTADMPDTVWSAWPAVPQQDVASVIQRNSKLRVRCQDGKVKVRLRLDHQVSFGEQHALLGSAECAGAWQKIVPMEWTETGWVVDLQTNPGEKLEYKYLIVSLDGKLIWENGRNRLLNAPSDPGKHYQVISQWDATQEELRLEGLNGAAASQGIAAPEKGRQEGSKISSIVPKMEIKGPNVRSEFVQEWQGDNISRLKLKNWDTAGLDAPGKHIVEGDQRSANWWRKLEVVRALLTGDLGKSERLKCLINASIYLKWINTGQIQCREDGGHYRPNKHAEISRHIFRELERVLAEKLANSKEALVARKIHPYLPAFKAEFTASVPLTRIRDIAHRNDIPHELKTEIKHKIQNKLHRNAGPEDLVATEVMLERVSKKPGEYSAAFVEQFRIFYHELKDFFNAGSLTEQLEGLWSSLDKQKASILTNFLESKKRLDSPGSMPGESAKKGSELFIEILHNLTGLRALLIQELATGIADDAPEDAVALRQKLRLCEIGLDDFSFVLLSRYINSLENFGGGSWLAKEAKSGNVSTWNQSLEAVILGVRQIELSGWQEQECLAIENELSTWKSAGILQNVGDESMKIWALRLKATLDRTRRLAEKYSDTLLQLYSNHAAKLGTAFGIPENSVKTYTEAEIRSSVVFQLSKAVSLLLKATRDVSGSEGWDVLMPGRAFGTLMEVDKIVPGFIPPSSKGPVILLVKEADGDEEVKAAGQNITGVILQHELPHLSHLGVRTRQEKVIFVTVDDKEQVNNLHSLLGTAVWLDATPEGVSVSAHEGKFDRLDQDGGDTAVTRTQTISKPTPVNAGKIMKSVPGVVLDLLNADVEKVGSKAAACGKLTVLADASKRVTNDQGVPSTFEIAKGQAIAFGAMEDALEASGLSQRFEALLDQTETAQVEGGQLDEVCNKLRELVLNLKPATSLIETIASNFDPNTPLIVRSSANVEDLAGMSGAGLYDSIPNVKPSDREAFTKAVAGVWSSLYTRRAVLNRRVAGVPQKNAAMAILVQELLAADLSFVLHTVSPIDNDINVIQAEIAAGLGETLASGTRGSPWRLSINKHSGIVKILAFANFSEELIAPSREEQLAAVGGRVIRRVADYSTKALSTDAALCTSICQRLASIGNFLEQQFECAQDIEGCIVGKDIYIVQTRPQP